MAFEQWRDKAGAGWSASKELDLDEPSQAAEAKEIHVSDVPTIVVRDVHGSEAWRFTVPPKVSSLRARLDRVRNGKLTWDRLATVVHEPHASPALLAEHAEGCELAGKDREAQDDWTRVAVLSGNPDLRREARLAIIDHLSVEEQVKSLTDLASASPGDAGLQLDLGMAMGRAQAPIGSRKRTIAQLLSRRRELRPGNEGALAHLAVDYIRVSGDVAFARKVVPAARAFVHAEPLNADALQLLACVAKLTDDPAPLQSAHGEVVAAYLERDRRRGREMDSERRTALEAFLKDAETDGERDAQAILSSHP